MTAVRAAQEIDALTDALSQWFNFFNGYDPAFTAAVPKPYEALTQALGAYAADPSRKVAGLPAGTGRRDERRSRRADTLPARTKGRSSAIRLAATACSKICAGK